MRKTLVAIICFFFPTWLFAVEYGFDAKRGNQVPITRYVIISERCSGSFYMSSLIQSNFTIPRGTYAHKHFPPWFQLPQSAYLGPREDYTFEGMDDQLFIVIFRDPYDWIRSFYNSPWHAKPLFYYLSFEDFIRTPWDLNIQLDEVRDLRRKNPLVDRNPITKQLFENVFKLRSAKIETMLMVKERAKNVYYINYETVRDYPEEVLEEIQRIFNLRRRGPYRPVIYYKGDPRQGIYLPNRKQKKIAYEDLLFINSQLDRELENEIGYRIIYSPNQLH